MTVVRRTLMIVVSITVGSLAVAGSAAFAQSEPVVARYKSSHFVVHTDLASEEVTGLLQRMEATLKIIAKYWGRDLRKPIQCYIVEDVDHWAAADFPNELAKILIQRVGGCVDVQRVRAGQRTVLQPTLYAAARAGVAEHEVVHAYCVQVFGATGPEWYKEGMAEMASNSNGANGAVRCSEEILDVLRSTTHRPVNSIVYGQSTGKQISEWITEMGEARKSGRRLTRSEKRKFANEQTIDNARRSYSWNWALCHFLCNNPNYRDRFRILGVAFLNSQQPSFDRMFQTVQPQLEFEYEFFLGRVQNGYRVDLCAWDWESKSEPLTSRKTFVRVKAARGYQPSGAVLTKGQKCYYRSSGQWSTRPQGLSVTADGDHVSDGRLVGVVLRDYTLSDPIELGATGSFVSPSDGHLFLRCRDNWNELGDNRGTLSVRISTDKEG